VSIKQNIIDVLLLKNKDSSSLKKHMKKAWRYRREIIVHQAPAEPEDARRLERLTSLLATGVERLLSAQFHNNESKSVDFQAEVLVNTHTQIDPTKTESK
jgi:hypothetical protein